jgi:hypothetical protein
MDDKNALKFWKHIEKIKQVFNSSISFQIGNEKYILFWQDRWIDEPLQRKFSNLFLNEVNKEYIILLVCNNTINLLYKALFIN